MGDNAYAGLGALVAVISIWSILGLAIYVWYLWALARLFPYIGLPKAHGWIPIYNQWRLIERGGLPGWMVLLGFIPGLSILVLVMLILSMHRINREHGEGGGMTVLAAFIPQIWAMILTNHLRDRGYAATPHNGNGGGNGAGWQQPSQLVEYGPDGQVYPLLGAAPAAAGTPGPNDAGWAMPAVPQHPYEAPPAAALFGESAVPPVAPPVVPQAGGWVPPGAPVAPAAPEFPEFPEQSPAAGTVHPTGASAQDNPWSLGATIDGNFERLANEELPPRSSSWSGSGDARPFSWPEVQTPAPQSFSPQNPVPQNPVQQNPSPQNPVQQNPNLFEPVAQQPPQMQAPAPDLPAPHIPAAQPQIPQPPLLEPSVAETPVADTPVAHTPATETSAAESQREQPQQPMDMPVLAEPSVLARYAPPASYAPGSEAPIYVEDEIDATVVTGGAVAPIAEEDDLDHTVMVARKKQWALELPDGVQLELNSDDVVIGRRPSAIDDSATLLIPDSTRTLSKSHARLRRTGEQWTIEDLNSTNGVFVFDGAGEQIEVSPGTQQPASEQLIIGTLEVLLRDIS